MNIALLFNNKRILKAYAEELYVSGYQICVESSNVVELKYDFNNLQCKCDLAFVELEVGNDQNKGLNSENGFKAIDFLKSKGVKVIAITESSSSIIKSIKHGVDGVALTLNLINELHDAVDAVEKGKFFYSSKIDSSSYLKNFAAKPLSDKEIMVIQLLANGVTQKEVAQDLNIELSTVKSHVGNILKKLGAINTVNAVKIAISERIIEGGN